MLAINDAYRVLPFAEIVYACDAKWWDHHEGCPDFHGEKWSSHDEGSNKKLETAERWGLHLIRGRDQQGFSLDPSIIHYGSNSGYQAINLAILMGVKKIILVGFDMQIVNGMRHFFGDHPLPMSNSARFETVVDFFNRAVKSIPNDVEILNCTPASALDCFRKVTLEEAL